MYRNPTSLFGSPLLETDLNEGDQRSSDPVTMGVIQSVASVADAEPDELPPLHKQIDPDSLDNLFTSPGNGFCAFRYYGYLVCVTADRTVLIFEGDTDSTAPH